MNNAKGIASSLNNMGLIYYEIKNYNKALEYYERSLKLKLNIDDKIGIASSLNNIGIIHLVLDNYEKALEYYEKSLKIRSEIDDKLGIGSSLTNIGIAHTKLKNYNKALKYLSESVKKDKEINNKRGVTNTLINIGNLFFEQHNYPEAIINIKASLKISEEIDLKESKKECYRLLSKVYFESKNFEKAFHYSQYYSKLKDSIYTEESSKKIAELQTRYETEKKEKEAEIYKLKNIELVRANKKIKEHQEHLQLITKILRHDLLNNLTVINSSVKMFLRRNDKSFLQEGLKKVKKSTELINKMRELEKLINSNQNLKPFSVTKVFEEVLKNYRDKDISYSPIDCNIFADDTIYSVFDNIISNAYNHGKTDKLDIYMEETADDLIIYIVDYGIGIPDKIKEKIFEESFKYGETGNTGLGLFIVKKALTSFGGNVFVEDNTPKGAKFILKFKKSTL